MDTRNPQVIGESIERAQKLIENDPTHPYVLEAEDFLKQSPLLREYCESSGVAEGSEQWNREFRWSVILYVAGRLSVQPIN